MERRLGDRPGMITICWRTSLKDFLFFFTILSFWLFVILTQAKWKYLELFYWQFNNGTALGPIAAKHASVICQVLITLSNSECRVGVLTHLRPIDGAAGWGRSSRILAFTLIGTIHINYLVFCWEKLLIRHFKIQFYFMFVVCIQKN